MSKARQLADLGNQVDDGAITGTNMIINGAMTVAQRGASQTSAGIGSIDRFQLSASNFDELAFTMSQDSDAPDGFSKSLKVAITTVESTLAADEHLSVRYKIEAQDLQMLDFNTANAKQTTLSFWVKSSDAATYSVFIYGADSGRMISENYTINAANTWEYKTITFSGDTGGAINDDNGEGFQLGFGLGAGSNYTGGSTGSWATYAASNEQSGNTSSIPTTTSATWQITGVCLNVGDSAIDFPHDESYGDTLAKCKRYFQKPNATGDYIFTGDITSGNFYYLRKVLPVSMRATPTYTSLTAGQAGFSGGQVYEPLNNNVLTIRAASTTTMARGYFEGTYQLDAEL